MMKHIKQLLVLLALLTATTRTPLAEGGLVFHPYWTFRTDAPVTHVQTGDINDDGVLEVVALTADNWVYVLENDGDLAWRYEKGTASLELLVADLDGDGHTAEIFVGGVYQNMLLSDVKKPVWTFEVVEPISFLVASSADLDEDGRYEILVGYDIYPVEAIDSAIGHFQDFAANFATVYPSDLTGICGPRENLG
jgi:hypothetical protein